MQSRVYLSFPKIPSLSPPRLTTVPISKRKVEDLRAKGESVEAAAAAMLKLATQGLRRAHCAAGQRELNELPESVPVTPFPKTCGGLGEKETAKSVILLPV